VNSQYKIIIHPIVLTTQIELNKQYVLSGSDKEWKPITFNLDESILEDINYKIIEKMKTYIFVNELELLPQLINIKKSITEDNAVDIIYGFVVGFTNNINNCFWLEFNVLEEKEYSNLILEVIQKLN
jgi:hypothetical protein